MMISAVLSNADHPEYGVATIPFPIPKEQFDHCMEMMEALEIGDPHKKDCKVQSIDSFYSVLKVTENLRVNLDELDYLAKRLESFDVGEAAQFQAMASKLELFELKDLISLTFCCQETTVITDFSDLEKIGREHYGQNQFFYDAAEGLLTAMFLVVAEYLPTEDENGNPIEQRHIVSVFKLVQELLAPAQGKGHNKSY